MDGLCVCACIYGCMYTSMRECLGLCCLRPCLTVNICIYIYIYIYIYVLCINSVIFRDFPKIRQVGAELFLADGQTDRHNKANSRFSQCYESI